MEVRFHPPYFFVWLRLFSLCVNDLLYIIAFQTGFQIPMTQYLPGDDEVRFQYPKMFAADL